MKILKIIGIVIGSLIALYLIICIFGPAKADMSRSVETSASAETSYSYLADFNNFTSWSPWAAMEKDPKDLQTSVTGTGVGSVYSWTGKKTGQGSMTVTGLTPSQKVDVKLVFVEPMSGEANTGWIIAPTDKGSKITWIYNQDVPFLHRGMSMIMSGMMNDQFDQGLANLKTKLESQPAATPAPAPTEATTDSTQQK